MTSNGHVIEALPLEEINKYSYINAVQLLKDTIDEHGYVLPSITKTEKNSLFYHNLITTKFITSGKRLVISPLGEEITGVKQPTKKH